MVPKGQECITHFCPFRVYTLIPNNVFSFNKTYGTVLSGRRCAMQNAREDITFDELIFLILKAADRPLCIPEIIDHLVEWQIAEIERTGGWDRFVPRPVLKALAHMRVRAIEDSLIFLCAEHNVQKFHRFTPQNTPWSSPHQLPRLRQFRALSWPRRMDEEHS
jgi:hypothetical protein